MSVTTFAPETEARLAVARQVADAVLFEGYVLYPYRASAAKNRLRWQFGVLVPPAWGADCEEHEFQHTECLMEPKADATLAVELRFLRARRRTVQRARPDGGFETVPELRLGDRTLVPWDEGTEERVEAVVPVDELLGDGVRVPFDRPAGEDTEPVLDESGRVVGRMVRRYEETSGVLRLSASELDGPYRVLRLTAIVENTSTWTPPDGTAADRDAALPRSLVATHLLMGLGAGSFLSMTDPPSGRSTRSRPAAICTPGRSSPVNPGARTWCCPRRSSWRTTRRSPRKAPGPCTTPPRSTRSSPCAPPRSPTRRSARPGAPTTGRPP